MIERYYITVSPLIILLSIFATKAYGHNYSPGDTLTVVAFEGLTLRAAPDVTSAKIRLLRTGEWVVVRDTLSAWPSDTLFGFAGRWVRIAPTQETEGGFVFDAFLSTLPLPNPPTKQRPGGDAFELGIQLPRAISDYAVRHFAPAGCSVSYRNHEDGERAFAITIQALSQGHQLVEQQYYEGGSTELVLINVRPSEVYYLVRHLVRYAPQALPIDERALRRFPTYRVWDSCPVQLKDGLCVLRVYRTAPRSFSVEGIFPL